jgi:DNA invertase Pin-like site-specific DNA recombinase
MTRWKPTRVEGSRQLDVYIRVSDTKGREGESFISPKDQRERVEAWLKSQGHTAATMGPADPAVVRPAGWPLPGEPAIWEELDVSGGTTDREMLNEVMRRIEAGETGGVVVAYMSRFGRTLVDTLGLIRRIDEAGGLFASVADQFDISTPNGRLVLRIMLSIAEYELERTSEQWDSAKRRAIHRDVHFVGIVPFGYQRTWLKEDTDKPEAGPLVPDPDTAPIVTELFARRASGESLTAIRDWLRDVAPNSRTWTSSRIIETLKRPTYLGRAYYGEHFKDGAHPALVDRATWEAAQHATTPRATGAGRASALLHGLVRCSSCRYTMTIIKPRAVASAYYKCNGSVGGDRYCPHPSQIAVSGPGGGRGGKPNSGLDDWVVKQFFARYPVIEAEAHVANEEIERLEEAVTAANADLVGYAGDREIQEAAGRDAFLGGLAHRRAVLETAKAELAEVLRQQGTRPKAFGDLESLWPEMTIDERRQALSQGIQAVFVRPVVPHPRRFDSMSPKQRLTAERGSGYGASPARVHIVWAGDPLVDVPRQGKRGFVPRPFVFPGSDEPGDAGVAVG